MPLPALSCLAMGSVGPGLVLGLVLLAAIAGGYTAGMLRLPRLVGYLLAGIGLKQLLILSAPDSGADGPDVAVDEAIRPLRPVTDLALGLVLFFVGEAFERCHLKRVGWSAVRIGAAETGCTLVLVTAACLFAGMLTLAAAAGHLLTVALLLGVIAMATAPAATLLVLEEYEAKGPTSDTLLTVVALNNIAAVVLFHVVFVVLDTAGWVTTTLDADRFVWLDLTLMSLGSAGLGVAVGAGLSLLHAKLPPRETLLIFFAMMLVLGAGRDWLYARVGLSFNFLLVCIVSGAVFFNAAIDPQRLAETLRTTAVPIYAAFFVLAGVNLHLTALAAVGWMGAAYVIGRTAGKPLGAWWGRRRNGREEPLPRGIGLGLLAQAGVAIGLADYAVRTWVQPVADGRFAPHPMATTLQTIVLACVAVYELIGPVLTKTVAVHAGEVKAVRLIRRREPRAIASGSAARSVWVALWRLLRPQRTGRRPPSGPLPLRARDVMRTNVRCLPADATFDDILRFVERSRFNHFPVADADGHCIGVIHFADLRSILYDDTLRRLLTAADLADLATPAVLPDTPLTEVVTILDSRDVGSLPVVADAESRKIVGVVEQRDVLQVLYGSG